MGLDMYLYAVTPVEAFVPLDSEVGDEDGRRYVYISGYTHSDDDARKARYLSILEALSIPADICPHSPHIVADETLAGDGGKVWVLKIAVAYWRKANAVHAWLVDECQGGVDECQYSDPIPRDKLRELRDLSQQALDAYNCGATDKARELLPPRRGFFFGSYEIDEWYAADLQETVEQIDRALALPDRFQFIYHSSW